MFVQLVAVNDGGTHKILKVSGINWWYFDSEKVLGAASSFGTCLNARKRC